MQGVIPSVHLNCFVGNIALFLNWGTWVFHTVVKCFTYFPKKMLTFSFLVAKFSLWGYLTYSWFWFYGSLISKIPKLLLIFSSVTSFPLREMQNLCVKCNSLDREFAIWNSDTMGFFFLAHLRLMFPMVIPFLSFYPFFFLPTDYKLVFKQKIVLLFHVVWCSVWLVAQLALHTIGNAIRVHWYC